MGILAGAAAVCTLLALYLGDAILAFLGDQLDKRRAYRLDLEREQTRRAKIEQRRDAMIWRELQPEHREDRAEPSPGMSA